MRMYARCPTSTASEPRSLQRNAPSSQLTLNNGSSSDRDTGLQSTRASQLPTPSEIWAGSSTWAAPSLRPPPSSSARPLVRRFPPLRTSSTPLCNAGLLLGLRRLLRLLRTAGRPWARDGRRNANGLWGTTGWMHRLRRRRRLLLRGVSGPCGTPDWLHRLLRIASGAPPGSN